MPPRSLDLIRHHQAADADETRGRQTDAPSAQRSIQDLPTELFLEILYALYASIFTLSPNDSCAWERREIGAIAMDGRARSMSALASSHLR